MDQPQQPQQEQPKAYTLDFYYAEQEAAEQAFDQELQAMADQLAHYQNTGTSTPARIQQGYKHLHLLRKYQDTSTHLINALIDHIAKINTQLAVERHKTEHLLSQYGAEHIKHRPARFNVRRTMLYHGKEQARREHFSDTHFSNINRL